MARWLSQRTDGLPNRPTEPDAQVVTSCRRHLRHAACRHYEELSLADALRALADHHYNPRTRHISRDEYDLLQRAASAVEERRAHV